MELGAQLSGSRMVSPDMEGENFAGAGSVLAVNSLMTKRVLLGLVTLLTLCLSVGAEQPVRAARFNTLSLAQLSSLAAQNSRPLFFQPALFSRLGDPLLSNGAFGPAAFSSREAFSLATTFNLAGTPTSFLPATMAMESPVRSAPATSSKDSTEYPLDLRPGYYVTGEVGFTYGRSTGKFGGEYKEGYIIGEVGNDKIHISVGAAYEDTNLRTFRLGR
jgi:hypothetical protein